MSESLISNSLVIVIYLGVGAMLAVNVFHVVRPFFYDAWEGVACLSAALAGYMIYFGAEASQTDLEGMITNTFLKRLTVILPWDVSWIIAALFGIFSGFFYGKLVAGEASKSFRWVLFLLALSHGVLVDLSLALYDHQGMRSAEDIVPSVTFVVGLLLTLAYVLPSKIQGHLSQGSGTTADHWSSTGYPQHYPRTADEATDDSEKSGSMDSGASPEQSEDGGGEAPY